jgi:hypothetical protein
MFDGKHNMFFVVSRNEDTRDRSQGAPCQAERGPPGLPPRRGTVRDSVFALFFDEREKDSAGYS